jgi:hypothetical protein
VLVLIKYILDAAKKRQAMRRGTDPEGIGHFKVDFQERPGRNQSVAVHAGSTAKMGPASARYTHRTTKHGYGG